ncbi:autotransporter outer membrane beta-barrel domain-containing protein [Pseudohoeflea coraliihabitans]|uniref:Autotransporter domain-containing protein n=1 Tax=Pseudohoeflea coraliihabitans TaxID=2860393 RepID=A0ABS6WQW6_9HYPH|nr:autotransporter outer membrane beta-barrel domain-containing protein [Pseudohoeflea sp. DP4N28-3]MBW3098359.1 hypothetical protein [Pseudohoeflea sp. DP4N28-3]
MPHPKGLTNAVIDAGEEVLDAGEEVIDAGEEVIDAGERLIDASGRTIPFHKRLAPSCRYFKRAFAALVATLLYLLPFQDVPAARAANSGCSVSGSVANCPDVPADGIRYGSGVKTINITDFAGDSTNVQWGVIGIHLYENGANGSSATSTSFTNQVHLDLVPDDDNTPDTWVVANSAGQPVLSGGYHIIVTGTNSFSINGTPYNGTQLAQHLASTSSSSGGTVSGSLTVNNPSPFPGSTGAITTIDAVGILVRSNGGNGGSGGCSSVLVYTWCDDGDRGGHAGSVVVNSNGAITVNSQSRYGVAAISKGGRGGNGGGSFGVFASDAGAGGNGGRGGQVQVILGTQSDIRTSGKYGHGVYAISHGGIGGGGGEPYGAYAGGDEGGRGGNGGNVRVENHGSISTTGQAAYGVNASSVGGAAGDGSDAFGIGADGGEGGGASLGGTVTVVNSGSVTTTNSGSTGIFVQSVGGGGGDGGSSGGVFAVGGNGASGGNGGVVTVFNSGSVSTGGAVGGAGDDAVGVFLQSVGGGGGNGGGATAVGAGVSLAIGGNGAIGGAGSTVTYNPLDGAPDANGLDAATISTTGDRSHGIQAQSVGGGGGNGGYAYSGTAPVGGISASIALGGKGGPGGASGAVTVNEKGVITTAGDQSIGLFAQSVGGGGGNGGGSVGVAAGGGYNLSLAIGGKGGAGGASNTVNVDSVGRIATQGKLSHGIMAQSVGGGGGNGGFSVAASLGGFSGSVALGGAAGVGGAGKSVTVNAAAGDVTDAGISTEGQGAIGIFAQSVGGGGGNGGVAGTVSAGSGAVGVSLGGAGGGGATGGTVGVTNRNTITTRGDTASGIFAQSVGGGGGNGGAALSGTGGVVGISVAVGGSGGGGSNGGVVTVDNFGAITTGYQTVTQVGGEDVTEHFGSRAYGIFAQSVGGGGGNGGFAIAGAVGVSIPDVPAGAFAISVGGAGGGASNGNTVTVNNHGDIETFGLGSHAIFAQSVGGGGGNGGFAGSVAMTVGSGAAVGIGVGGRGSGGGNGGVVTVNADDALKSIITHADGANGIHAQSVGGGGGDGGFAMSGAFGFSAEKSVNVAVAIGGAGGAGGTGNEVNVTTRQAITTYGHTAHGVMAQSVGGGGGNGGMAVSGTLAFSESAGQVGVSVGGAGGSGSIANTVRVDNFGAITTWGSDSIGILGQSIGGSGGNGGLSIAAQMTGTSKLGATIGVAIGGGAGNGNYGGEVHVSNRALSSILTNGMGSHGIKAQSIGGGGGNGGMAVTAQLGVSSGSADQASKTLNVGASVGGSGGTGGYGNLVHVINNGTVTVKGLAATGIFAQSVGGGGGDGGGAVSAIGMLTDSTNASSRSLVATVAIGGSGGSGNHGGAVTVDNNGAIVTEGASGYGVYAQSVGGGGGIGGRANTMQMVLSKPLVDGEDKTTNKNNMSLSVSVGGDGGSGSDGGDVTINNHGTIETHGELADGINAQSIGAGGGHGGNGAMGPAGLFPLPGGTLVVQKVLEKGFGLESSVPIYKNVQIAVGGSSGATGDGGIVEVNNDKNITTHGSNSNAIFAQSVGGGGGVGGKAIVGATGLLGLGGEGSGGGDGKRVTVNQSGGATIETFGVSSYGISAQSVGGGGGIAGNVDRMFASEMKVGPLDLPSLNAGVGLAFGRGAGGGGDGGQVDVDVDGIIKTHGNSAAAIFAQSVGGGGGMLGELGNEIGGVSILSFQIGSKGDVGNAGQVDVDLTGTIMTAGNSATGIFAQSAAGAAGGGHAGTAGNVNIAIDGSVLTGQLLVPDEDGTTDAPLRGLGSAAIFAQSVAGSNTGNGNVTVTISGSESMIMGGRSQRLNSTDGYVGVGVWVMDGKTNTITNHGTISTIDGVDNGYAILAQGSDATHTGGDENVQNFGTVTGSFDLGAGSNSFVNNVGGVFNAGRFASVGGGNTLSNAGLLNPGGSRRVMTSTVTGGFTQTATGTYGVDMDLALTTLTPAVPYAPNEADALLGDSLMTFDGGVDLTLLNIGNALPGEHKALLARSSTSVSAGGLTLTAPASAVATYALDTSVATDLSLDYAIDFSPDGMNANQSAIGEYINQVQLAGGAVTLEPVVEALFNLPDLETYSTTLNQLTPEPYAVNQIAAITGSMQFQDSLMSCRVYGGTDRFNAEGECAWASGFGGKAERDATAGNLAYESSWASLSMGAQTALNETFRVGLGLSYASSHFDVGENAGGSGEHWQLGGVIKAVRDGTTVAASLTAGTSRFAMGRLVALPAGPSYALSGEQQVDYVAGHARISHTIASGNSYIRPYGDIGLTHVRSHGFSETGGPIALDVNGGHDTFATVEAAVEVGTEVQASGQMVIRPFASVGVLAFPAGTAPRVSATFRDAPAAAAPFTTEGEIDSVFADARLGMDLVADSGVSLRAVGEFQLGENTRSYGGNFKLGLPF